MSPLLFGFCPCPLSAILLLDMDLLDLLRLVHPLHAHQPSAASMKFSTQTASVYFTTRAHILETMLSQSTATPTMVSSARPFCNTYTIQCTLNVLLMAPTSATGSIVSSMARKCSMSSLRLALAPCASSWPSRAAKSTLKPLARVRRASAQCSLLTTMQ